jgi:hypothetical protein
VNTTNLLKHLRTERERVPTGVKKQYTERSMKIQENKIGQPAAKRQLKILLARDLAIMISKSLLLFNKVYEVGFSSFCLKYNVIATKEDMPHRTTISRDALRQYMA